MIVESALIFLTLFALILGIIDFGHAMFLHTNLSDRVRAAARYGIGRPYDAATRTAMENIILYNNPSVEGTRATFGLQRSNVSLAQTPGVNGGPGMLTVNVHGYGVRLFAPYLAGYLMGRTIQVSMPVESAD